MSTPWTNDDGLNIHFGPRDTQNGRAAKVSKGGQEQEIIVIVEATKLTDAVAASDVDRAAIIPSGAYVKSADIYVDEAFTSGGSAVLDIGLYQPDGTAIDDDGIDSAVALGALVDDAEISGNGAVVGTSVSNDAVVAASYDTAAFTAGRARVVVKYVQY
jgi:hypothetical protein